MAESEAYVRRQIRHGGRRPAHDGQLQIKPILEAFARLSLYVPELHMSSLAHGRTCARIAPEILVARTFLALLKPHQLKRVAPGKMTVTFITSLGKETAEFTVTR